MNKATGTISSRKLTEWAKPEKRWAYCLQNEHTLATHDEDAPALSLLEKLSPVNAEYATLAHELVYAQIYAIFRMSGGRDSDIRLAASLFIGKYAKTATLYSALCYFAQYATEWKKTLKDFDAQDVIAQYKAFHQHWLELKERCRGATKPPKDEATPDGNPDTGLPALRLMVHRRLSMGEQLWDGAMPDDPEERRRYLIDHSTDIGLGIATLNARLHSLVRKYAREWQHTPAADSRPF